VVTFEGHNVRGLQSEGGKEELIRHMNERGVDVYAMQETWEPSEVQIMKRETNERKGESERL
jgi:hypothetical protein